MSASDVLQEAKNSFQKAFAHLQEEFRHLQIGRASSVLVEDLLVEAYGTKQPLKGLASISVPDPKTIQIQPWDRGVLGNVEKAVLTSGLNLNPVNDGLLIRIFLPALTEERRAELSKVVYRLAEEAKIVIRNSRHDAHNVFKTLEEKSEVSEDEYRHYDKKLQEDVDKFNKDIDELAKTKENDIMTI